MAKRRKNTPPRVHMVRALNPSTGALPPGFEGFDLFDDVADEIEGEPTLVHRRAVITRMGAEPTMISADRVLKSSYIVGPGSRDLISPAIDYFQRQGVWMTHFAVDSAADAERAGLRLQKNLIARRDLHYSDPALHDKPLFAVYDHGYVELPPIKPPRSGVQGNPSIRYTVVPVDDTGDERNDESVVVRGGRRDDALRAVAQDVDADAWIDLAQTRTFPTKKAALVHADAVSPRVRELARRVAKGGR